MRFAPLATPHNKDREAQLTPRGGVIIQATEIVKTYDTGRVQVLALRGVSLAVERGEMVAIYGAVRLR